MKERLSPELLQYAHRVRQIYWKVAQPHTFGARGLIFHPEDSERIALVQHTYGNKRSFLLPGGGYNPRKENPETAWRREVREELGLGLSENLIFVGEEVSTLEGKIDRITFLAARAIEETLGSDDPEIAKALWVPTDLSELPDNAVINKFVHSTLEAYTRLGSPEL